jgi:hypothetical protein
MREESSVFSCRCFLPLIDCEPLSERCGDVGMQLLASAAQERAIGSVLNQGMLEYERPARLDTAAENQPGADELIERVSELVLAPACDRGEQLIRKFTADCGAREVRYGMPMILVPWA